MNERELAKFHLLDTGVGAAVVPTTVQLDLVEPDSPPTEPVIGMLGSMCYPPNVHAVNWFGQHVWPLLQEHLPAARWLIVGRDPARSVRRWGQLARVEVTGYVPDVRPYLAAMRVFANPVRGDIGVQSKLLVALAAGRPAVVTSDAAAGLMCPGVAPFLIANSPRDFAAALVRLAIDHGLWLRMSHSAREMVEAHYTPQRQVEVVERLLAGGGAPLSRGGRRKELTSA